MDFLLGLCYPSSQISDMAWFIFSGWLDTDGGSREVRTGETLVILLNI